MLRKLKAKRGRIFRSLVIAIGMVTTTLTGVVAQIASASAAHAQGTYDNGAIADKALTYVGQWGGNACKDAGKLDSNGTTVAGFSGGQCRTFVNCILWMVSGGSQYPTGTYFQSFLDAGGVEITAVSQLTKGDIVQYGDGTHTFIIVSLKTGSTFDVVDSNYALDEKVSKHSYDVILDTTHRAFRMGTVNSASAYIGQIIKKASDGTTSWLVEGDLKKHWIPSGGDYNCFVAQGKTVTILPDATVAGITDAVSDYAKCTPPPPPYLYEIQHQNTASGRTEVKEFDGATHYTTWIGGWVTPDGWHNGSDVDYGLADYGHNGTLDIYEIHHQNTASGMTEVSVLNGANSYTGWIGGWVTPDGVHSGDDVNYVVGDYNGDGIPDVYVIQHKNSASGMTEVKVLNGATNFSTWIGGWVTPDGWHGSNDVDYVLSNCGSQGGKPNLFVVQHQYSASGMTEVKVLNGANNYTTWVGGWVTPDGWHSGNDVDYTVAGCNGNGMPNIYVVQHQNSASGHTEVRELNGSGNFTSWIGGWTTPDGWHSGADVHYVMSG